MSRICLLPLWILLGLLFLGGCSMPTGSSTPISSATLPYSIAPLDTAIIVTQEGVMKEIAVGQDGKITLPSGDHFVQGMSLESFQHLLRSSYPSARSITVREFRTNRVTVLGEVFHQIHTDLTDGPMRVMDAIASANGFTPLANKRRVRLLRQNAGTVQVYELDLRDLMKGSNLDQNLLLEPGDVITVPRNFL